MKKIILKTAIVFSISIVGILNFNLLAKNMNISELTLSDLFIRANAACENPTDVYSWEKSEKKWIMAMRRYEEYKASSETNVYNGGGPGCLCTETKIYMGCSGTFDSSSWCNPTSITSDSCS